MRPLEPRYAAFAEWLLNERRLMPSTVDAYRRAIVRISSFPDPVAHVVRMAHEPSQLKYRGALKSWAVFTHDAALLQRLLEAPRIRDASKTRTPKQPFTRPELEAMARQAMSVGRSEAERFALALLFESGARCHDITAGVRRDELQAAFREGYLRVYTKGDRRREVELSPVLRHLGAPLLQQTGWRFLGQLLRLGYEGKRHAQAVKEVTATKDLRVLVQEIGRRAGVSPPVHPHRIRRTLAVEFWRLKPDLEALMRFMGWESERTALRYIRGYGIRDLGGVISGIRPEVR